MRKLKIVVYLATFLSIFGIGLWTSWKSIPNQEGYFEISWNLTYINFKEFLLRPQVTPLNYLLPYFLTKVFHISLANAWKFIDLFFGGLTAVFLVHAAIVKNNMVKLVDMLKTPLLIISSVGSVYPLTSMTGEGLSVLVSLVGLHFWLNYSFVAASLLFSIAVLSKYTIYLILPGLVMWTVLTWPKLISRQRKKC